MPGGLKKVAYCDASQVEVSSSWRRVSSYAPTC